MKLLAALLVTTTVAPHGAVLVAGGAWAAIDRGTVCEALSRSVRAVPKDEPKPSAGFAFTTNHRRWGEFHAQLSRPARPGSSVILQIGDRPFLLVVRGAWAWSTGPAQEAGIIDAIRSVTAMRVEGHDGTGHRFSDPYILDGAPTAIDAAAARCALRGAGKIP